MTATRGGYPCPYAHLGCEYTAPVQSMVVRDHEPTCPMRPRPQGDE